MSLLAIIVRFSDRWVTERSQFSYEFWEKYFSINNFYDYLSNLMMNIDPNEEFRENIFEEVLNLLENSKIIAKSPVREIIGEYILGRISYSIFKTKLDAYKHWEFFYRLKSDAVIPISLSELEEILKNPHEAKQFLQKFTKIYRIIQTWLSYFIKYRDILGRTKKSIINKLFYRLKWYNNRVKSMEIKKIKSENLINEFDLVHILCLYNIYIRFLKEFFQFRRGF